DYAIDLGALHQLGYFKGIELTDDIFLQDTLNDFISDGRKTWRLVRNRIADIFDKENPKLSDNEKHRKHILFTLDEVEMQLPVQVGDYTDFYSSKEHATNVGTMSHGKQNAQMTNRLLKLISYAARNPSIIPSGIIARRPWRQTMPDGAT